MLWNEKTNTCTPQFKSKNHSAVQVCAYNLHHQVTQAVTAGGSRWSVIPPAGFRNRKITGLCASFPPGAWMVRCSVQWVRWRKKSECEGGRGLKRDEVYQVALGRSHAVREEVDEGVEELRPLSVRLVDVWETWEGTTVLFSKHIRLEDFHQVCADFTWHMQGLMTCWLV